VEAYADATRGDELDPAASGLLQVFVVEQFFGEQKTDPYWSRGAEEAIRTGFDNAADAVGDADVRLRSVECRTTVCRVKLSFAQPSGVDDVLSSFRRTAWKGPGLAIPDTSVDGEGMLLFLGKEGTELPDPG
jgi:hypothetical protein